MKCEPCNGTGMTDHNGCADEFGECDGENCSNCNGDGHIDCNVCEGTGEIE